MQSDWTVEIDETGRGRVTHHAAPRFRAFWVSGTEALPAGPCWTSPGSGPEDALSLFGGIWLDPAPEPEALAALMQQAAAVIDDWIVRRF